MTYIPPDYSKLRVAVSLASEVCMFATGTIRLGGAEVYVGVVLLIGSYL